MKYVNSSYFWVCTSLSRMPLRSALVCYGGVTLVNGVAIIPSYSVSTEEANARAAYEAAGYTVALPMLTR